MSLELLYTAPGICKVDSGYAAGKQAAFIRGQAAIGRYTDGNLIRFVAGSPEKIGGWVTATSTAMTDVPRASTDWRDNSANPRLAIGTQTHLYYFDGTNIVDITPLRTISTGTLTNPITTTSGSKNVAIADNAQNLVNGDHVYLSAAAAVGGVTVNGWYTVASRTGSGYNITVPVAAGSNAGPGGGTTTFNYPRVLLGNNPFATTSGSAIVTVTHTAHGATTGDYATFGGATAVAGLTINGEYKLTVVNPNSYTINAGSNANATTSGGGAAVNVTYDITIGQISGLTTNAYGSGSYGSGPYGYIASSTATTINSWTLAAYGTQIIACPVGGTIYLYDPVAAGRAYPVLNAPSSCLAIFVTPERFLFALGISGNSMQLAWPDQSDITNWTSLPSNTANSGRSLQGGTFFVAGTPVANGVSLFFSNRCCFEASYAGDNEVYNTPLISDLTGLIGPGAVTTHGGVAYWMGDHDFWQWNGTVTPMLSDDIRDYVFTNINTQYQSISVAGTNRAKKEVWFFYPSSASTEIDSYVIAHIDQPGVWSVGKLQRTTWRDSDLFDAPYATDASGKLYLQETTHNGAGLALDAYIVRAATDVGNGNVNMDIFGFIPDFERLTGSVSLTVNVQQYPQDTPTAVGPFTITDNDTTPLLDFRTDGKLIGYRMESNVLNGDFRLGVARVNVQQGGARL